MGTGVVDVAGRARELLAAIGDAAAGLRGLDWTLVAEQALLAVTGETEATVRSCYGVQVRLASEINERGTAQTLSARSAADLLRQMLNITPGDARGRIATARAVLPHEMPSGSQIAPALPDLLDAVDAGLVSEQHAAVIAAGMAKIPAAVDTDTRAACAATLLDQARQCDPGKLRQVAEQLRLILDPDGSADDKDTADRAELHIGSRRSDGLTPIRGLLDPLGAEHLRQAIEPLAAPRPGQDGTADPRPAGLRRAQALAEVCRRYLARADGPRDGGVRPQVVITVGLADLLSGAGPAFADYGGALSARAARMLACDADLIPQVLGTNSVVLDQGRAARLFGPPIRRAITTRDRGCTFPGCDIPSGWSQAHHIAWWKRDLGPTSERNGTLLCSFHHHVIHQGAWTVQMAQDGLPQYIPPPHIDPLQRPRRNTHWPLPDPTQSSARGTPKPHAAPEPLDAPR